MLKWLLLGAFAGFLIYAWRRKQRHRKSAPQVESLVRCSRCHRHLSIHSAIRRSDDDYRCTQHAGDQD
ncbi:MAG: hypothetical protein WCY67_06050 [Acidithiobacillus sp.]